MKKSLAYTGLAVFLALAFFLIWLSGRDAPLPYARQMEKAAQLHAEAARLIREEKARRGIELAEEDTLKIGLMGTQFSAITTTLGGLPEKRTSQLPDFAALCVRYFHEAGLKEGDVIGANFSGSYPGLNLAVLCAAEAMGCPVRYSSSIGSSEYGANDPGYVFPEMLKTLFDAGLIPAMPGLITMGGGRDMGGNMMAYVLEDPDDLEAVEAMKKRLEEEGLTPAGIASYAQDIYLHEKLYGDIRLFVNVGGNSLGLGASEDGRILTVGNGLLAAQTMTIGARSGLIERYMAKGLPTVHLLGVKALCEEGGIAFDPDEVPRIGSAALYRGKTFSLPAAAAVLAFGAAAGILIEKKGKKAKDYDEA